MQLIRSKFDTAMVVLCIHPSLTDQQGHRVGVGDIQSPDFGPELASFI